MNKKEIRRKSEPNRRRSRCHVESPPVTPSDDETSSSESAKSHSEAIVSSTTSSNVTPPRKSEQSKSNKKLVTPSSPSLRGHIAIGSNRTNCQETATTAMNDRQRSPSHDSSRRSPHSVRVVGTTSSASASSSSPSPTSSPSVIRRVADKKASPSVGLKIKVETPSKHTQALAKPHPPSPMTHSESHTSNSSSVTTTTTTTTSNSNLTTRPIPIVPVLPAQSRTGTSAAVAGTSSGKEAPALHNSPDRITSSHMPLSSPVGSQDQHNTTSPTDSGGRLKSNSASHNNPTRDASHTTKPHAVGVIDRGHSNPSDISSTRGVTEHTTETAYDSPSISPAHTPPESPREAVSIASEYPTKTKLTLNSFKILKLIGKGGYGEVYLVEHKKTKKKLALKIMDKELIFKRNKVQHIKNERDVLVKGKVNPHLVRLHYSFQDRQYLYLAMEYCPGGDLRSLLNAIGTLEEEDAKLYFAEMISSVKYLHSLGYIHRDLKPENFLIDRFGHLKLADFGLSKEGVLSPDNFKEAPQLRRRESLISVKSIEALSAQNFDQRFVRTRSPSLVKKPLPNFNASSSQSNNSILTRRQQAYSIVGSPDYMSPEVLRQEGYGEEVDWWSLGIIFFEVLLGGCPFTGDTPEEVFRNISNWRSIIPALLQHSQTYLSPACFDLLSGLLSAPEKRMAFLKGPNNTDKLRTHPFFAGLDWDDLRKHTPPFIPKVQILTSLSIVFSPKKRSLRVRSYVFSCLATPTRRISMSKILKESMRKSTLRVRVSFQRKIDLVIDVIMCFFFTTN